MLVDLVIDTNVFAHCDDLRESRRHHSLTLVSRLLDGSTLICVDEGYDPNEAKNKSRVCKEYQDYLRYGNLGLALIAKAAGNRRLKELPRRASQAVGNTINQLIRDKVDRIFLNVAYGSKEKKFVSHDYVDFQVAKRKRIRKNLGIEVCEACDCIRNVGSVLRDSE